jgi:outer membrane protein assembly factor BamB
VFVRQSCRINRITPDFFAVAATRNRDVSLGAALWSAAQNRKEITTLRNRGIRTGAKAAALISFFVLAAPGVLGNDWPQWRGPNRDGVWTETGTVEKLAGPELKVKWRVPVSNGYSGPIVANGRVYITDRVTEPKEIERVHCFDAQTGKTVWTHTYDCKYEGVSFPNGPRAAVTVHDGRAYSLGSMGNLICFDAAKGTVQWSKDLNAAYKIRMPDWGIAASPLIEGDKVIVFVSGSDNACVIAFDRKTGKELWKALPDRATYSSPIVIDQAGKRVLVVWTAERLVGLDPANGSLYWEQAFPARSGAPVGFIVTPVVSGDWLFVSAAGEGSLMLRLRQDKPAVLKAWAKVSRNIRASGFLQTLMTTPILRGDHIYGVHYFGELRCLDAASGEQVWEETNIMPRAQWASAHLVQQGDKTWIFNEKGELILSKLSPKGYQELGRALLIKPTRGQLNERGGVTWSHPAFANQHVFARNDEELVCVSLKAG